MAELSKALHTECLMTVVLRGFEPRMDNVIFCESNGKLFFLDNSFRQISLAKITNIQIATKLTILPIFRLLQNS